MIVISIAPEWRPVNNGNQAAADNAANMVLLLAPRNHHGDRAKGFCVSTRRPSPPLPSAVAAQPPEAVLFHAAKTRRSSFFFAGEGGAFLGRAPKVQLATTCCTKMLHVLMSQYCSAAALNDADIEVALILAVGVHLTQ